MPSHLPQPRVAVVVLGAGSGTRVGADRNKVLLEVAGRPLLAWSVRRALAAATTARVLVVARADELDGVGEALAPHLPETGAGATVEVGLVAGGATRHGSERAALRVLEPAVARGEIDVVSIHDGARPLAAPELFDAVARVAAAHGAALPGRPLPGLVQHDLRAAGEALVGVQTPQAARARDLLEAYRRADETGFEGTDTAACLARFTDLPVVLVDAPATNLKVTFAEDVDAADLLLGTRPD